MALIDSKHVHFSEIPLILQLDIAGNPVGWCNFEKSVYYKAKDLIAWEASPKDITLQGGISRMTGKQSTLTINTIIAVRGNINKKQYAKINHVPLTNRSLFYRDHNTCAYCGSVFKWKDLSRDHIIPTSKGGPNTWENVVTACHTCNRNKSNHLLQDIDMELLYVPYAPNKSEHLILQNRRILADQMSFLMKRVPKESRLHTLNN